MKVIHDCDAGGLKFTKSKRGKEKGRKVIAKVACAHDADFL
jgi:hypothetical protein